MAICFVGCIPLVPEEPVEKTEYEQLVEVAQLQAVKIAVIEQGAKLANYYKQLQDPNSL